MEKIFQCIVTSSLASYGVYQVYGPETECDCKQEVRNENWDYNEDMNPEYVHYSKELKKM